MATVRVDDRTGQFRYLKIDGGERRKSAIGYLANFCAKCVNGLDEKQDAGRLVRYPRIGDRIKYIVKPEWGIGQIINLYDYQARIYFVNAGEKGVMLDQGGQYLILAEGQERDQPLLDIFKAKYMRGDRYNIYIIRLSNDVLRESQFVNVNRDRDPEKPCLYVGMTGLSPQERFENHKIGHKSSYYPHRYGIELLPAFYECINPLPLNDAKNMEIVLAALLRRQGYAVWQN